MPRSEVVDGVRTYFAYFENEQGSQVSGQNVFFNKFKPPGNPYNLYDDMKNYLDPGVRTQRQPQDIPKADQGQKLRYDFFIGSKTWKKIDNARTAKASIPEVKVTLLYGVGQDLDNLGLRYFFEQVDDRVLINISGMERGGNWGIGITGLVDPSLGIDFDQIKYLFTAGGLKDVPYKITILAAYSTGYHGLNLSVTEGLIPLKDLETVIYFDCVYRHDKPPPSKSAPPVRLTPKETNSGPDEIDAQHRGSAFNTRGALTQITSAASNKVNIVGYMATKGGSPLYTHPTISGHQYTVDIPTMIDLRAASPGFPVTFQESLFALVLTRCLAYALIDKQVNPTEVPVPFTDLAKVLPQRGQVASTIATLKAKPGFSPATTLLDWGKANAAKVKEAQKHIGTALTLVSTRALMYPGGYPDPGNPGGLLHAGLLPEFGWEFLV